MKKKKKVKWVIFTESKLFIHHTICIYHRSGCHLCKWKTTVLTLSLLFMKLTNNIQPVCVCVCLDTCLPDLQLKFDR